MKFQFVELRRSGFVCGGDGCEKKVTIAFVIIGILAISTMIIFSTYKSSEAYRKAKAKTQWECSVVCAEKSTPDSYVITYSDAKILSNTGVLTVQNRNDFDIIVHLLCEGKQELVSDSIPAGGCYSFLNVTDKECWNQVVCKRMAGNKGILLKSRQ